MQGTERKAATAWSETCRTAGRAALRLRLAHVCIRSLCSSPCACCLCRRCLLLCAPNLLFIIARCCCCRWGSEHADPAGFQSADSHAVIFGCPGSILRRGRGRQQSLCTPDAAFPSPTRGLDPRAAPAELAARDLQHVAVQGRRPPTSGSGSAGPSTAGSAWVGLLVTAHKYALRALHLAPALCTWEVAASAVQQMLALHVLTAAAADMPLIATSASQLSFMLPVIWTFATDAAVGGTLQD